MRREKCKAVLRKVRGARLCKDKEQDIVFDMYCVNPNAPHSFYLFIPLLHLRGEVKSQELGLGFVEAFR